VWQETLWIEISQHANQNKQTTFIHR
jgi:hypothetical protein